MEYVLLKNPFLEILSVAKASISKKDGKQGVMPCNIIYFKYFGKL
jgi:hypothetical protein